MFSSLISQNKITYKDYLEQLDDKSKRLPRLMYYQNIGLYLVAEILGIDAKEFVFDLQNTVGKELAEIPAINHDPAKKGCGGCAATQVTKSRGLGDTVAKVTHATGLDKLAEMYTKITGKPCGCQSRQEALNKLMPYGFKEDE